jgi:hypothetical protein
MKAIIPPIQATAMVIDGRTVTGVVLVDHPRSGSRAYHALLECGDKCCWLPPYQFRLKNAGRLSPRVRRKALDAFGDAADAVVHQARVQRGEVA